MTVIVAHFLSKPRDASRTDDMAWGSCAAGSELVGTKWQGSHIARPTGETPRQKSVTIRNFFVDSRLPSADNLGGCNLRVSNVPNLVWHGTVRPRGGDRSPTWNFRSRGGPLSSGADPDSPNGESVPMRHFNYAMVALGGLALLASLPTAAWAGYFRQQTNLVTNNQSVTPANNTDPNLVNPSGHLPRPHQSVLGLRPRDAKGDPLNGLGVPQALVVNIPPPTSGTGPTGQVFNNTTGFIIPSDGSPPHSSSPT